MTRTDLQTIIDRLVADKDRLLRDVFLVEGQIQAYLQMQTLLAQDADAPSAAQA